MRIGSSRAGSDGRRKALGWRRRSLEQWTVAALVGGLVGAAATMLIGCLLPLTDRF